MKQPYEILLRFDHETGKYKGGHTIRFDTDTRQADAALPIGADKAFPWPDEAKAIDTAVLARVSELESLINDGNEQRLKLQAEFDEYKFQASAAMDLANGGANDAIAALKGALAKSQSDLAALQSQVSSGIATIQGIVADPDTDTEKGIIAFLKDATKDERTKRREALEAQLAALEKQIATLV